MEDVLAILQFTSRYHLSQIFFLQICIRRIESTYLNKVKVSSWMCIIKVFLLSPTWEQIICSQADEKIKGIYVWALRQ